MISSVFMNNLVIGQFVSVSFQFRETFIQVLFADFVGVFLLDRILDFLLGSAKLRKR